MPWVRIDEEFSQHPKVVQAGPLAMAMQVAGLCYCNRHLTDGFVPRAIAATLLDFTGLGMRMWAGEFGGGGEDATWELVVEDLEGAGIWERVEGGWQIHDYSDYQPKKREVIRLRRQRSEAGRKGGQAKAVANGQASAKQPASNRSSKNRSKQEAKTCPVPGSGSDVDSKGLLTDLDDVTDVGPPVASTEADDEYRKAVELLIANGNTQVGAIELVDHLGAREVLAKFAGQAS